MKEKKKLKQMVRTKCVKFVEISRCTLYIWYILVYIRVCILYAYTYMLNRYNYVGKLLLTWLIVRFKWKPSNISVIILWYYYRSVIRYTICNSLGPL